MAHSVQHLVIGGSGMLSGVCLKLAETGHIVSVVGCNREKLERLRAKVRSAKGKVTPVAVDYSRTDEFMGGLKKVIASHGAVSTIVSWVHSHSRQTLIALADLIGDKSSPPAFFDILGSMSANPRSAVENVGEELRRRTDIRYHCIVLGFKLTTTGSRWLTDEEICEGVLGRCKL